MKTDNSVIYSIRWDNLAKDTYLYGSDVAFNPDGSVKFKNPLMPPGQIIRKWQSDVNYQATRHEPQLPVLEEGELYEVRIYAGCKPEGGVKLRLRFFDRQGEAAGTAIIHDMVDEFSCPMVASSYELELINAGAGEIFFHHIEIQKKSGADMNVRIINPNTTLYVLILETTGSSYIFPEDRILNRFRNRVILTCEGADAIELNSCVTDRLPHNIEPRHIVVVGYGKRSNESAARYAKGIGSGVKLCTYGCAVKGLKAGIENIVYDENANEKKVVENSLMDPICDKTNRLMKLRLK
ncbi:MAG: accessory Sec system protein Asp3 [Butyrivibrio sp.]|uniref:accessory Sec system protein Asp3 n=1 Tax=Butyrivibrio sp. TaxID=28121 RepID=UPI001B741213|nr:accessory Sec system protein Asp3 [Butyrivibrio sp.]MBP3783419.1 accessory Sec system protein Asp3 [Butyrivibrio sp.]